MREAEQQGCDFDDAGKQLTVRRYLQSDGINGVEELLEDTNAVKMTVHPPKKK